MCFEGQLNKTLIQVECTGWVHFVDERTNLWKSPGEWCLKHSSWLITNENTELWSKRIIGENCKKALGCVCVGFQVEELIKSFCHLEANNLIVMRLLGLVLFAFNLDDILAFWCWWTPIGIGRTLSSHSQNNCLVSEYKKKKMLPTVENYFSWKTTKIIWTSFSADPHFRLVSSEWAIVVVVFGNELPLLSFRLNEFQFKSRT